MQLYHEIGVGGKLLANKSSVPSHIQLEEDKGKIIQLFCKKHLIYHKVWSCLAFAPGYSAAARAIL